MALLQSKIDAIAQGDFSRDPSIEWKNEFGTIGKGINQMSENVVSDVYKRQILLRPPDRQRKNTHFPWKKTPAWSLSVFSFILFLKTPAAVIRPVLPVNVPVLVQPCQSFHIKIISPDITFIHPIMIAGIVGGMVRIGTVKHQSV